jgi:Signal transduction histidine kinase
MDKENNKAKFQRKIIFVKRNLQLKFVAFVLLSVLFGMVLMIYEFLTLLENIFYAHPVLLQVFFEEGSSLLFVFVIKVAICFAILALLTAVISNKIAGPIYRFESACRNVAKGDFSTRVKLRDGDSMKELEQEFNQMMDKVQDKLKEEKGEKKND